VSVQSDQSERITCAVRYWQHNPSNAICVAIHISWTCTLHTLSVIGLLSRSVRLVQLKFSVRFNSVLRKLTPALFSTMKFCVECCTAQETTREKKQQKNNSNLPAVLYLFQLGKSFFFYLRAMRINEDWLRFVSPSSTPYCLHDVYSCAVVPKMFLPIVQVASPRCKFTKICTRIARCEVFFMSLCLNNVLLHF